MGHVVSRAFTRRHDGDFHIGGDVDHLERIRAEVIDLPWTWLRQVHGSQVVVVSEPGASAGATADAAVTAEAGAVLAVHTADCVPVLLFDAAAGVIGAAHAGWRGLVDGVLEATVAAMAELGATQVRAEVGPHIRARCYEFGTAELDQVAARYGPDIISTTAWGAPALDMTAGVGTALAAVGVPTIDVGGCTACESDAFFSHRARGDAGRMAGAIWLGPS